MIRIAICEDSPEERDYISDTVRTWSKQSGTAVDLSTFSSAEAFLFHYDDEKDFDILLLDVEMNEMNGVDLAKHLRNEDNRSQIVFITGYPDYMAQGYDVSALHYLLKPVMPDRIAEVLNRAMRNIGKIGRSISLRKDGKTERVFVDQIVYAEIISHRVVFQTLSDTYEARMTITEAKQLLGDEFIQCHRSYIVALKFIKNVCNSEVTLDNGAVIPLSRQLYKEVNSAFLSYYGVSKFED
ncbi:MAG: response regulator transcription factor [Ruminococcaceae bacterium]|nr:response regulator transcription factor [Oscillospiraceae bacterium]